MRLQSGVKYTLLQAACLHVDICCRLAGQSRLVTMPPALPPQEAPGMDPESELQRLLARYRDWKKQFKVCSVVAQCGCLGVRRRAHTLCGCVGRVGVGGTDGSGDGCSVG